MLIPPRPTAVLVRRLEGVRFDDDSPTQDEDFALLFELLERRARSGDRAALDHLTSEYGYADGDDAPACPTT